MGKQVQALFCNDDKSGDLCKNDWNDAIEIIGPYKSDDIGDQNDEWNYIMIV
jgi:hypothetical protein